MTMWNEHEMTCVCGNIFMGTLYQSINITLDPPLLKELFDCKINVVECPNCHTKTFFDMDFVFHDMDKHIMYVVIKGKGEWSAFLNNLDSKGYFDKFKKENNFKI
jgi:hypothetical protein